MPKKTFSIYKIIAIIIVTIIVGISINFGNWYLPVIAIIASWLFLYSSRKRVKEVIADERDYIIAGKASALAMNTYLMLSSIIGIILYSVGRESAVLFNIALTLLYSACFLMVLYVVLFKMYEKKDGSTGYGVVSGLGKDELEFLCTILPEVQEIINTYEVDA